MLTKMERFLIKLMTDSVLYNHSNKLTIGVIKLMNDNNIRVYY